jgi:hypothetical protein
MAGDSIYVSTLRRAMELLGGERKLASYLRVPSSDLREWLAGHEDPPLPFFLAAVDVVLKQSREP